MLIDSAARASWKRGEGARQSKATCRARALATPKTGRKIAGSTRQESPATAVAVWLVKVQPSSRHPAQLRPRTSKVSGVTGAFMRIWSR